MISRDELNQLIDHTGQHMLSIYMHVDRPGAEMSQNPIRLKNLIDEAEARLQQQGLAPGETRDFLAPIQDVLNNTVFWQEQNDGLVIFRSPDRFLTYQAPVCFDERVYLNTRFYTRPLIDLLESGIYYLLALSLERTRLFRATRYEIHEMDLGDTPVNLSDAIQVDELQRQFQFHPGASVRQSGDKASAFSGQAGSNEDSKKGDIRRFFQILDREIYSRISGTSDPMLLAGLEYLLPMYRDINQYPHLYKENLQINPDGKSAAELHQQSWKLIRPFFDQARKGAIDEYHIYANQKQASKDIQQIVPASSVGQVETLLITHDIHIWGTFNPETLRAEVNPNRRQGSEDLVDTAVANTLRAGGTVFCYSPVEMPDGASIAAVLRYPLDGINYKDNQ